jgi:hypothetical protein
VVLYNDINNLTTENHALPIFSLKIKYIVIRKYIVINFRIFFENYLKIASVVLEKLNLSLQDCILAVGKAEIQFLENYTGDFQITFKKDSKLHSNVFSAIKKLDHRGYLSAIRRLFWLI